MREIRGVAVAACLLLTAFQSSAANADRSVDADDDVDHDDILLMEADWHTSAPVSPADLDEDGDVDAIDLFILAICYDPAQGGIILSPTEAGLLPRETQPFAVVDPQLRPIDWVFAVNGAPGGSASDGFITADPFDPLLAFYTAPLITDAQDRSVAITAWDPANPVLSATAGVVIRAVTGEYALRPADALVGLGATRQFEAGLEVAGDFYRVRDVYWSVNGVLQGRAESGVISTAGVYRAPYSMPPVLPYPVVIGFSLASDRPAVATAAVVLAELDAKPDAVDGLMPGPAAVLSATLIRSDNTQSPVALADLVIVPDVPGVGGIDAVSGNVTIGDSLGRSVPVIAHPATGAFDTMLIESRSDIALRAEVEKRTKKDFARIARAGGGVTEIEYTRPEAVFNFAPVAAFLRGQNAGDEFTPSGPSLTFSGDGTNVVDFSADDPFPALDDVVAVIERESGFCVIGHKPGRGTIAARYHDGAIDHTVSMDVIFSRVEIAVSAVATVTGGSSTAEITEHVRFTVRITNPNGAFFGDTPIRVTLPGPGGNEPFWAGYFRNVHTGGGAAGRLPNQFEEFGELLLTASSTGHPANFFNAAQGEQPGVFEFLFSPKRPGAHRFHFEATHDDGVAPKEFLLDIMRTRLTLQHPPPLQFNLRNFLPDGAPVVVRSFVNVYHRADGVGTSPFDLVQERTVNTFSRYAHNDAAYWTVTDPQGRSETVPVTDLFNSTQQFAGGRLPYVFPFAGTWTVTLGLLGRPEVETAPLAVNVVNPEDVAAVARLPVTDSDSGELAPASNQLGALEILAPDSGGWAPGVPIPVEIQCYAADGTPKSIGKEMFTQYFTSPPLILVAEELRWRVVGLRLVQLSRVGFSVEGEQYPLDGSGKIAFTIIPSDPPGSVPGDDLIIGLVPQVVDLFSGDGRPHPAGLLRETRRRINSEPVVTLSAAPYGVADFADANNNTYKDPCLFVSGGGLAAVPRQLPVPTQRLQDAVAAGKLPAGSDRARTVLHGNDRFAAAMASGVVSVTYVDFDSTPAIPVVGSRIVGANQLEVTLDLRFAPLRSRTFTVTLGDGSRWEVALDLFRGYVADPGYVNHADKNIPLNGRHHNAHPVGSQQFGIINEDFGSTLHKMELELVPSIRAGDTFRGRSADQDLVGFDREYDASLRKERVRTRTMAFFQRNFNAFHVYGNISDDRTLDPETKQLGPAGEPDGLPDFVSRAADAEQLLVRMEGNLCDVYEFTAMNLIAEVAEDLPDPGLDFDAIKDDIGLAYQRYSVPVSSESVEDVAARFGSVGVTAFVDQEAGGGDLDRSRNTLNSFVPKNYFAGVLDQYYLKEIGRGRFVSLGKDGRVRAFNGDRGHGLNVTGRQRRGFGIELDALLFDPKNDGPFDLDPNAAAMRSLPVARRGSTVEPVTALGLVAEKGGASGGFFELDRERPGVHFVVARTPGAEVPGLHAGYLIQDTSKALFDPYLGDPEDDIEDVAILRQPPFDEPAAGSAIQEEDKFFKLTKQRRRVHTFGGNRDGKDPIVTQLQENLRFRITTDPPGVDHEFPIFAALWLREQPVGGDDAVSLMVTTQSSGSEGLIKASIDAAITVSVDLASMVILGAVTGGGAAVACGELNARGVLGSLAGVATNFAIDTVESEVLDGNLNPNAANVFRVAHGIVRDGQSIPGFDPSIVVSLADLGVFPEVDSPDVLHPRHRRVVERWGKEPGKAIELPLCTLLKAPFEALEAALKDSVSVESLGGNGAAEAIGERQLCISIPPSAQLDSGGLYNAQYSLRRVISIVPKEPYVRNIPDVAPNFVIDSANISDLSFLREVKAALGDPARRDEAQRLLRYLKRTSVWRESGEHGNVYRDYKIRYAEIPSFEVVVAPRGEVELGGRRVGNYVLRNNHTEIGVSTASLVTVSRSNENATAQGVLSSNGIDIRLVNASIPTPFEVPFPVKPSDKAGEDPQADRLNCCILPDSPAAADGAW